MALIAGSLDVNGNFVEADSLAKSIDDALPNKPTMGQAERRQLLIAIATGMISYLKAHDTDSFSIAVTVNITTGSGTGTLTIS
jgi:hypothetical protein